MVRSINSLGYKEITLRSDTERETIAFRNRVAENCNAEVTLEDAVKGDKTFKRIGRERCDVVARCHQNHQVQCGELHAGRTRKLYRARDVRMIEHQDRWDKEAVNNVIRVPWLMASGLWTDRQHRLIRCHHHWCRWRELECRGRESPGQKSKPSVPLQDAHVAMRSNLESEHKVSSLLLLPRHD